MEQKIIFAKLLATLRKNKENALYASISQSNNQSLINNVFILTFDSVAILDEANRDSNKKILLDILKNIDNNLEISFNLVEQKKNTFNPLEFNKKEFGDLLKIKRKGEK